MNTSFYDLSLFIGITQGLALSVILFLPKFKRHRFLAVIVAIITLSGTVSFLWSTGLIVFAPHLLGVTLPLLFLLGPCYFFYVRNLFGETNQKTIVHFLPAITLMLLFMPFYLTSTDSKLLYISNSDNETMQLPIRRIVAYTFFLVHISGYLIMTNRFLTSLQPERFRHFRQWMNWARILQTGLSTFAAAYISFFCIYLFTSLNPVAYRDALNLITTFFIHLIAFGLIYQTNLSDQPGASRRTTLYNDDLVNRVSTYIETEKRYLNAKLKLSEMAHAVGVTPQRLSDLINQHFGKSFTDFVNEYRVNESKKILTEPKYEIYDMDGIARLSGFQSRTNLTRVFKKHLGITPSEFRNRRESPE